MEGNRTRAADGAGSQIPSAKTGGPVPAFLWADMFALVSNSVPHVGCPKREEFLLLPLLLRPEASFAKEGNDLAHEPYSTGQD